MCGTTSSVPARSPRRCARFGGLDALVYATGRSPLFRLEDADGDVWRELMETNVIGAAMVSRAALPHLEASSGRLLFLGSSSVGRPYPGLVAYATSKAALHEYARGLRNEYPWLRVTNFVVGPTMSEFANEWDQELAVAMFGRWSVEGYAAGLAMATEDMADADRPGAGQRRTCRRGPRHARPDRLGRLKRARHRHRLRRPIRS